MVVVISIACSSLQWLTPVCDGAERECVHGPSSGKIVGGMENQWFDCHLTVWKGGEAKKSKGERRSSTKDTHDKDSLIFYPS